MSRDSFVPPIVLKGLGDLEARARQVARTIQEKVNRGQNEIAAAQNTWNLMMQEVKPMMDDFRATCLEYDTRFCQQEILVARGMHRLPALQVPEFDDAETSIDVVTAPHRAYYGMCDGIDLVDFELRSESPFLKCMAKLVGHDENVMTAWASDCAGGLGCCANCKRDSHAVSRKAHQRQERQQRQACTPRLKDEYKTWDGMFEALQHAKESLVERDVALRECRQRVKELKTELDLHETERETEPEILQDMRRVVRTGRLFPESVWLRTRLLLKS